MKRVAIIGAGMTKFLRRAKETGRELAFYATRMALENSGLKPKDIQSVAFTSAPDAFDGIHMKGECILDSVGGVGRPFTRCYVGGGSGVFALIHGWYHVASGYFDTCLVVAEEKMSSCQPHPQAAFLTIFDHTLERPLKPNLLWIFAMEMNAYMTRYSITEKEIALVSVKNKRNALDHPCAQLPAEITVEDVLKSEIVAYPVRRLMVSPTSDGAVALILVSEEVAKKVCDKPVWVEGVGWCIDTAFWTNRDLSYPKYVEYAARQAYRMAEIKDPRHEIHVAEVYDPFSYKELHHIEGLLLCEKGKAPRMTEDGITQRDGELPVNPSGGLLGVGNPIAAAGLMKVAEIFWQLKGEAGKRQVKRDVRRGLAQAWGDLMQIGTVVILGV